MKRIGTDGVQSQIPAKSHDEYEADRLSLIMAFIHVAENLSFTKASEVSGIEPSTVSRRVSRLEDSLKTSLLSRTTRKVALTESGQIYLEECRKVMDGLANADAMISSLNEVPRGLLRVSMPVAFGERHLTPMISNYLSLNPEVQIEANFSDRFVDMIAEKYDVAIRTGKLNESGLVVRKIAENRRILIATPQYLERYGTPETPADLLKHNCLHYSHYENSWRFVSGEYEEQINVSGSLVSDSSQAIYNAVLGSVGVGIVAEYMCYQQLASGAVVSLLDTYMTQQVAGIYLAFPTRRYLPLKTRSFLDFVVKYFRNPVWIRSS